MKCGGHVGRSHANALKQHKTAKEFATGFIDKHMKDFPAVKTVKCNCTGEKHSANCGSFTDAFIESARRNLYCAITQCGNDSTNFATRMMELGQYHARGIHQWNDGECSFHPARICSCSSCSDEEELKCPGKTYESRNMVTCPMHALAYEIECHHRANDAADIIDPDLGRGHTNLCESTFSVLTKFCPKDTALHRLHYQASTNLGLIQACMTYLFTRKGSGYHWMLDLFERMGLPLFDGMKEQVCFQHIYVHVYSIILCCR